MHRISAVVAVRRRRQVQVLLVLTAILGLTFGILTTQLAWSQAHDLDSPECSGYGRFSFEGAESIDDLAGRADLVIRGTVLERRPVIDIYNVIEDGSAQTRVN